MSNPLQCFSCPHFAAAIEHFDSGRLDRSEMACFLSIESVGESATALHLLARIAGRTERYELAVRHLNKAMLLAPEDPTIAAHLAVALSMAGQKRQSFAAARNAAEAHPSNAECQNSLGLALLEAGRLKLAERAFSVAVEISPDSVTYWHNLGRVRQDRKRLAEAEAAMRKALSLLPNSAGLMCDVAAVLTKTRKHDEAVSLYRRAIEIEETAMAWNSLGEVYNELGLPEEALDCFRNALSLNSESSPALVNLTMHHAAHVKKSDVVKIETLLTIPSLDDHQQAALRFARARIHDRNGNYSAAASEIQQANARKSDWNQAHGRKYQPNAHQRKVEDMKAVFTSDFFEQRKGWGNQSTRPIFIFGMPRSGTTLTEQILAAHPEIHGAGELRLAANGFRHATHETTIVDAVSAMNAHDVRTCADRHLQLLKTVNTTAKHIVDKMPGNYLYLGWIRLLFPNAKLIRCVRDPRDVALSCLMTNFQQLRWTNHDAHLIHRFEHYHDLMSYWRKQLPGRMFEIRYESLVVEPKDVLQPLFEQLKLPWSDQCLNHTANQGVVRTASVSQARRPIYTSSVGRWRNYATHFVNIFNSVTDDVCEEAGF